MPRNAQDWLCACRSIVPRRRRWRASSASVCATAPRQATPPCSARTWAAHSAGAGSAVVPRRHADEQHRRCPLRLRFSHACRRPGRRHPAHGRAAGRGCRRQSARTRLWRRRVAVPAAGRRARTRRIRSGHAPCRALARHARHVARAADGPCRAGRGPRFHARTLRQRRSRPRPAARAAHRAAAVWRAACHVARSMGRRRHPGSTHPAHAARALAGASQPADAPSRRRCSDPARRAGARPAQHAADAPAGTAGRGRLPGRRAGGAGAGLDRRRAGAARPRDRAAPRPLALHPRSAGPLEPHRARRAARRRPPPAAGRQLPARAGHAGHGPGAALARGRRQPASGDAAVRAGARRPARDRVVDREGRVRHHKRHGSRSSRRHGRGPRRARLAHAHANARTPGQPIGLRCHGRDAHPAADGPGRRIAGVGAAHRARARAARGAGRHRRPARRAAGARSAGSAGRNGPPARCLGDGTGGAAAAPAAPGEPGRRAHRGLGLCRRAARAGASRFPRAGAHGGIRVRAFARACPHRGPPAQRLRGAPRRDTAGRARRRRGAGGRLVVGPRALGTRPRAAGARRLQRRRGARPPARAMARRARPRPANARAARKGAARRRTFRHRRRRAGRCLAARTAGRAAGGRGRAVDRMGRRTRRPDAR